MNIKEELGFIKMWFETIRDESESLRNANGVLVSPRRMLEDVHLHAKDASEYVEQLIKEL